MSRIPRLLSTKKDATLSPELLEKVEIHLNKLAQGDEPEAFEPTAIKSLARELENNPSLTEWFFQKIGSQPSQHLSRLLLELSQLVTSKPVQKGIKRTVYLLKQRGMDLPAAIEKNGEISGKGILKAWDSVPVTGYLSEFDPARNRMVAMLIPKGPKGKVFVFALIDPDGSLASLTALEVNKKGAKEILGELEEHSGHSFLEADPGQVAFVLKEAHDQKSILSQDDEGMYVAIINLLSGLKTLSPAPIIRSLFPLDQVILEGSTDINRLMAIPEVSYFLPADEVLEPYRKALQEVEEGILILNQAQKREQVNEIIQRAGREIFRGQGRVALVRYLEEVAYLYFLKGQSGEAKVLCSAAQFLDNQGGFLSATENVLLIRLAEKALLGESPLEKENSEDQDHEQSQGGIIIPPWVKR
ncbi:MAG: hypothetical protein C0407_03440 [Desulfobacca sp.]|nr:hypothetical protein [Desulfobacca sp.]